MKMKYFSKMNQKRIEQFIWGTTEISFDYPHYVLTYF